MGRKDPTEFRDRFQRWKQGLPAYKDGKRYIKNDDDTWTRITDDQMADQFANLVVTPNNNKEERVVRRPDTYNALLRKSIHDAGYVTDWQLEQDTANRRKVAMAARHVEDPLETVSPEFDLLMMGAGLRSNPLTQQLWRSRALSKEMNKVFDEGLIGATKDMPVLKSSDVYNPEHFISTVKYNPKQIGVQQDIKNIASTQQHQQKLLPVYNKNYATIDIPDEYAGLSDSGSDIPVNIMPRKKYISVNQSREDAFSAIFDKIKDPDTGLEYYIPNSKYGDVDILDTMGSVYGYKIPALSSTGRIVTRFFSLPEQFKRVLHPPVYKDYSTAQRHLMDEVFEITNPHPSSFFEEYILPEYRVFDDVLEKAGMPKGAPRFMSEEEWNNISLDDRFNMLFKKEYNDEYGISYYKPRGYLKDYIKPGGTGYYNARFNKNSSSGQLLTDYPSGITSRDVVFDEKNLPYFFGEVRKPTSRKIIKPKLPEETVNWDEYRQRTKNLMQEDWDNNGPLSTHLKRSGINNPDVLLDYMMSPEQAWKQTFSKPGLDVGSIWFKHDIQNNALKEDELFSDEFFEEINKSLESLGLPKYDGRYGYDAPGIRSYLKQIEKSVKSNGSDYDLDAASKLINTLENTKQTVAVKDIFDTAFQNVLDKDKNVAKRFYSKVEDEYDNAFAQSYKGTMYISPKRKNFTRVVSHEFGHLEDLPEGTFELPGVVESHQLTETPSGNSALFKKAFDVSNSSSKNYFVGRNGEDATEMAQRATQIADYLKLKPGEEITPEKLKYAIEHYVEDTGMDNNMTEFFETIKDIKYAAKWMSIFHKALIPAAITGVEMYKHLKPRQSEKK